MTIPKLGIVTAALIVAVTMLLLAGFTALQIVVIAICLACLVACALGRVRRG